MDDISQRNASGRAILLHILQAAISLFVNGFGVYLTILAGIGVGPWDVLAMGLSNVTGIRYGNMNVMISFSVLVIDLIMREPIGIAMIVDALVVGKTIDLFLWLNWIPAPSTMFGGIAMMIVGLVIMGYSSYFYMNASLGCGPRDTMLVGLTKRLKKVPIGIVQIMVQGLVTLIGFLLGETPGVGTLIVAFLAGPILQFAFFTLRFDATKIRHQNIRDSFCVLFLRKKKSESEDKS